MTLRRSLAKKCVPMFFGRLAALLMLLPSLALAKGWQSSGGELFKDAHNPWFVKNTSQVQYCVEVDASSVSLTQAEAIARVEEALLYWSTELAKLPNAAGGEGNFALGGQTWARIACSAGLADVRFLFGAGTLSKDEKDYLIDPSKFVGITVRTDYDETNLRGRGFVYISSDFGPHRYSAGNTNLVDRAWKQTNLLRYALVHEIGHIHGFPHMGAGIMSETFLEQILQVSLSHIFAQGDLEPILAPAKNLRVCDPLKAERGWFGVPGHECVEIVHVPFAPEMEVYAQKVYADPTTRERIGKLKRISFQMVKDYRTRPSVVLHLNPSQKVFTDQEAAFRPFMFGPMMHDYGASATFVGEGPAAGVVRPVYFHSTPTAFVLQGALVSGVISSVFSHHTASDVLFMRPPTP